MRPGGQRGRVPSSLDGLDYAVYNAVSEFPGITTSDLVSRLSGYRGEDVREAVRHLRKCELIYKRGHDSCCRVLWKVRE